MTAREGVPVIRSDRLETIPPPTPVSADPESEGVYRCHICQNTERFIGYDAYGLGDECTGKCNGYARHMAGDEEAECTCHRTVRQPFTVVAQDGTHRGVQIIYGLHDGTSPTDIGAYTKIECGACRTIIYQSSDHVERGA